MEYYVDGRKKATGDGSRQKPFRTISEAAVLAGPGDEVIVQPGIYREHVDPATGGTPERRIVYRAAKKGYGPDHRCGAREGLGTREGRNGRLDGTRSQQHVRCI